MDIHNETAIVEHEATTSKISEDQIFYCNQRGISTEDAIGLIVNGYAKEVLNKLPMEFAVESLRSCWLFRWKEAWDKNEELRMKNEELK